MSPDFTESYQCMWLFGDTLNSYNQTHYLNQPGNTVKPAESSTYPAINTATYVFDFSLLFQAMHKPVETALGTTGMQPPSPAAVIVSRRAARTIFDERSAGNPELVLVFLRVFFES